MLKHTVPQFVAQMSQMAELFAAEQPELDKMVRDLEDMLQQFYIKTSTYSLGRWEEEFGLPKSTTLTTAERRAAVLAKLNTNTPASVKMLENLVEQIIGANKVTIVERPREYCFDIYVNTQYVTNLKIADRAVYEARPAHLNYRFLNELIRVAKEEIYIGISSILIKTIFGEMEKYKISRHVLQELAQGAYGANIKIIKGEVED